jgi:hypothetical protein
MAGESWKLGGGGSKARWAVAGLAKRAGEEKANRKGCGCKVER